MDWMNERVPRWICTADGGSEAGAGAGGAGGAGEGGAAAILGAGDGAAGEAAAGAGGDGGDQGAAAAVAKPNGAGADPDWLEQFSADGGDADNPSNRDWLKAKGFKSIDEIAHSYREAEKALRSGGKFSVPGDKAKPEEIAAFRTAIGVPEKPDGYEVAAPEGHEIDNTFLDPMRTIAHEAGVPGGAFAKLAEGFIQWQGDQLAEIKTAEDADAAATLTSWGDQKDAKLSDIQRAMAALEITNADIAGMQRGLQLVHGKPGSGRILNLFAKLGAGLAEDVLIGGGRGRFGITAAEAKSEIERLTGDEEFRKKLIAKDPAATQRWNRLNEAVAAETDRQVRAATATE